MTPCWCLYAYTSNMLLVRQRYNLAVITTAKLYL
jgi:hypothetical protein